MPEWIQEFFGLFIAAAIIVIGLLIYGFRDLRQLSFTRAWAISSVCFAESMRRRVLLITPLAILGAFLISQFQRPIDEQDAIRQTIKFCLFAAGFVVVITSIILACTNLPKEIESRVIFTVVTKPTTRLEIVVGKIIGFSKVSLAILALMGVFTWGYLHVRAWSLQRNISSRLESGAIDPISRASYQYWQEAGLLNSRTLEEAGQLQVLARMPGPNDTKRWFFGGLEGNFVIPFYVEPNMLIPDGAPNADPGASGVVIQLRVGYDRSKFGKVEEDPLMAELPVGIAAPSTSRPAEPSGPPSSAKLGLQILDTNFDSLIGSGQIEGAGDIELTDPTGQETRFVRIPPVVAPNLLRSPIFYVNVLGLSPGVEYFVDVARHDDYLQNPVALIVPGAPPSGQPRVIGPMNDRSGQPALPTFRSGNSLFGQQIRGGPADRSPVGILRFRGANPVAFNGKVGFEFKASVERGVEDADETAPTEMEITVVNREEGAPSYQTRIFPENNRVAHFEVPYESVAGGNFDILARTVTTGHYVNVEPSSLSMVQAVSSFDWNLVKSLLILWMLSILVIIIAIFCSMFLSWPIAVVLTLFILLGHWGVLQLGDALAPGIGNQIATDLGLPTASQNKVVSESVEAMSRLLRTVSQVLPDIEQFSAIERIERGLTIPPDNLLSPLVVLVLFGLPMLVLSYVILRNKEVAP
jgi:ABC-type transport system involved in multi-copper enzyme maturation permease subunit